MILVCGEALYDLFCEDANADPLDFHAHIGGSPFNVAIGLSRLGQSASFYGGISTDILGQRLAARLEREGVDTTHLVRPDAPTTLSLVQMTQTGQPAYTFYGTASADRSVSTADLPHLAVPPVFLHVGSYTVLVEPIAGALKTLIDRERPRSLISFDPNIRPTVVADMDAWRANTEQLAAMADVIKVSDEDLALIHPGEDPQVIARQWVQRGTGLVVVTHGASGVFACTPHLELHLPAETVTVVDTVGAGDTFQAALLFGLAEAGISSREALATLDEAVLRDILATAVRASAITCSRQGADLPHRADLMVA